MPYTGELLLTLGAYALGSVSTGYYLVQIRTGKDIRRLGSGSTGSRNVARLMGPPAFVATLAGDAAKGALAAWAALLLGLEPWGVLLVIFAVVAGHIWPIQLGFQGGRGLATVIGAVVVLDYWLVLAAFLVVAITLTISKNFTLSGLVAVALTPGIAVMIGHSYTNMTGLALVAALILFAHRENIRRIARPEIGPSSEGA